MPLSDIEIKKARPSVRIRKLVDGGGLFLQISPTGGKYWKFYYRFDGKQKELSLGRYPTVTLKQAREIRAETKDVIADGEDPATVRRREKLDKQYNRSLTFEVVARKWFKSQRARWVDDYAMRLMNRLEGDIFPEIGDMDIRDIKPLDLLTTIQKIEDRGAVELAKRIMGYCGQIFRYGVARGMVERDISQDLKGALQARKPVKHRAAIMAAELPTFLHKLANYDGDKQTKLALKLILLIFVRTSELRFAEWSEFENLKGARPLWRIPAERMKMRSEHLVPLAPQVVDILHELPRVSSKVFAAPTADGVISQNTMIYALYRLGYHSRATVHGFRRTASTILNESGFNRDWIEVQLAHTDHDQVRAAYNAAEYLEDRRQMMTWWADYIDAQERKEASIYELIG